ncbi:rRNA (cytosine-C(5))-methyltransferase NOP2C isoform X2 [Telopea speciosissima]|uniref:rRNA (cytosine-C(5))-methyltransferase NOP2C isoform X2 n=1 Tax=Telopea speciosissima TaxID=54955 RepID=UPI001CC77B9D|nr:rRNA (cytosine-C(5))-methyltransferase NOP2C isoform X2 [Telopea speciosissima]
MKKVWPLLRSIRSSFITSQTRTHTKMDHLEHYSYNPTLRWNPQVEEYFIKAYGADHFSRISKALTHPSCYSCIRVNTLKSSSDAIILKLLETLEEKGLNCATDGKSINTSNASADVDTSQKQGSFSKEIHHFSDQHFSTRMRVFGDGDALHKMAIFKCQIPGLDNVVFVKGSGPHTIQYGDASNKPLKEVIVSRKCAEAVLRGAQVFVPGALACSAHVEKGDTVAVSVVVEQPSIDGRWGVGMTRGTVLQGLETDVLEGEIFLQNLPSIITAHALDPQSGERILDMCAAPGGKTTAIAILMKDEGEVVAVDRSHNKVMDIQKLAAEMGLTCITTYKLDALKAVSCTNQSVDFATQNCNEEKQKADVASLSSLEYPMEDVPSVTLEGVNGCLTHEENATNKKTNQGIYHSKADIRKNARRLRNGLGRSHCKGDRVDNSKGFPPNSFDRILLDAPCSALGLRPRLFAGQETIVSLRNHGRYQRRMFDQAVKLVRPGGVIVYSTCTINPGENEALVRYALDRYKFLSLAPQNPRIGGPGLVGRFEYFDGKVEEWLRPGEEELVQKFDPSSLLDTIGFFIAKFNVGQCIPDLC